LVETSSDDKDVFAQGYITSENKIVLVVNKLNQYKSITIYGIAGGNISYVDATTNYNPYVTAKLDSNVYMLKPFAVAIFTLPNN